MSVIFSNIENLLPINQMILDLVENRIKEKVVNQIGDVFIQVVSPLS